MPEAIRKVNVIGHLHPDTDSICSAISYAYLKNQIGPKVYEARRAGTISRETAFVLKHFGFEEPELITSVSPQIKDIDINHQEGIAPETSLFAAWLLMGEAHVDTLCITDKDDDLQGLIALKDIATANLDIFDTSMLSVAHTMVGNIAKTLDGQILVGDKDDTIDQGNLCVGTTPEMMDGVISPGDIVLVTNRYECQQFAVECGASCLVICCGADVSEKVRDAAERAHCTIITTPYDTYATARLICMSCPVRARMLTDDILKFSVNTAIDDAQKVMAQSKHRYFPVIDEEGHYAGMVSTPNLLTIKRKHVILVDHNERSQAVEGLEQAEIMEIIDHHRIGTIETSGPVTFRNMPVGCTCTIIYSIFQENDVEIPREHRRPHALGDPLRHPHVPLAHLHDRRRARRARPRRDLRRGHRVLCRRHVRGRCRPHGTHRRGGLPLGLQGLQPWPGPLRRGPEQLHDREEPQGRRGPRRPLPP